MSDPIKEYTFFIEGRPAPGGSKNVFPVWRGDGSLVTTIKGGKVWPVFRVVDAGKGNEIWKAAVTLQGRSYMRGHPPITKPIEVEFHFFLRRPQNHYRTGKFSNLLKDDAPRHHTQAPDALKYARSTEDALTGVLWHDDSGNVEIRSRKSWAKGTEKEGCAVKFRIID